MDIMWPISKSHFHVSCLCSLTMKFIHCHSCAMFVMKSAPRYLRRLTQGIRCDEILGQGSENIREKVPDDFYMHQY